MVKNKFEQERKFTFLINKFYHLIFSEKFSKKINFNFDKRNRLDLIKHVIKKNDYKNYLEIGCHNNEVFDKIEIEKIGVDPISGGNYRGTSDKFFKENLKKFDCIFIDGLHLEYQVDNDIKECLNILSSNGFIVMHDCNPPTEFHQRENYEVNGNFPPWNGTVWKSFAKLRIKNVGLNLSCVDCDWGVGIIKKDKQSNFKLSGNLDFDFLDKNRVNLLNLISVINFIKSY